MASDWLESVFSNIYDDGTRKELLGGVNFIGFTIEADAANKRYNITNPSIGDDLIVVTINGATVVAPTEGAEITTTAQVGVDGGSLRKISSAGGSYSITLDYDGSPLNGEGITFYCLAALANAISFIDVTDEATLIQLPVGFKGAVSFWYTDDPGDEWALSMGSIYRVP